MGLKALLQGKLMCSFTSQNNVRSLFHHLPGYRNRMHEIFQKNDRSTITRFIHDTGVQGHFAFAIGTSTIANGAIIWIRFRDFYAGLHRIQGIPIGF